MLKVLSFVNGWNNLSLLNVSLRKMRYVTSYVTLVLRLLLPVCLAVYYTWLRNQRTIVNGVRRQLVPAILAAVANSISLSTVLSPSSKFDPILRTFRVIKFRPRKLLQEAEEQQQQQQQQLKSETSEPEKCVKCDVLYDPSPEPIRADVIFIHGLHGSLDKTWKQGIWDVKKVRTVKVRRRNSQPANHSEAVTKPRFNRSKSVIEGKLKEASFGPDKGLLEMLARLSGVEKFSLAQTKLPLDYLAEEDSEGEQDEEQDNNNEKEPYSKCWPRDWLPRDCPGVRVIALNYTTDPYLWRPLWITKRNRTCMVQRGREMMDHLKKLGVGKNPIIWVGHSKGGLFVKQMIVDDCREVLELHAKFLSLIDRKHIEVEIFSFIETVQTFMTFLYIQIVSVDSAVGMCDAIGGLTTHKTYWQWQDIACHSTTTP
ncbi:hypothetical protein C0J52_04395 [Blattella germanica]|nr:hypothetical protein C0J52_04395 [Blattella germanica]